MVAVVRIVLSSLSRSLETRVRPTAPRLVGYGESADAHHLGDDPRAFERQCKGPADQPYAEDGELAKMDIAHGASQDCKATCNARKKRSFSDSSPTVTRKCSGMP